MESQTEGVQEDFIEEVTFELGLEGPESSFHLEKEGGHSRQREKAEHRCGEADGCDVYQTPWHGCDQREECQRE